MDKIDILNSFLTSNKMYAECVSMTKKGYTDVFDLKTTNSFRLAKLSNVSQELMLTMKAISVPSLKINFNTGALQLEMIADQVPASSLTEDLYTSFFLKDEKLPMILGTSFHGEKIIVDVCRNPHMLIGGTTGSGKSSLLHNILANLLLRTNAKIHIVDTKAIEFSQYAKFSRCSIIDNFGDYHILLEYLIHIMEKRYSLLKNQNGIELTNNSYFKPIVVLIDEFADLSLQDEDGDAYKSLCRLVQKCRAAGIYCILATQRPSADIITGVIKANFPARLACKVASKIDSRIILDSNGAENLIGTGNAIISNYKYTMEKFQMSYSPVTDIISLLNEKMAPNT